MDTSFSHTNSLKNPLEVSLLNSGTGPNGVRRPVAAAVATAGVQRRRVIKKHIQQKYMLCGFAIHVHTCIMTYWWLYGPPLVL